MAPNSARDLGTPKYKAPISDVRELRPDPYATTVPGWRADPTAAPRLTMTAYGATDTGLVRSRNEDQFVVATLTGTLWVEQSSFDQPRVQSSSSRGHLLVVADGMGGHLAGEEASHLAVEEIEAFTLGALTWLLELRSQDAGVLEELRAAVQRADLVVTAQGVDQPKMSKMGTTLTIGYNIGDILYLAHAGDSRCYLMRGGKLRQITQDHTIASELVAAGALEPNQAPDSMLRHVVTNVVGGGLPGVRTDVQKLELESGDIVLLCTDGLTEMVSHERIAAILTDGSTPGSATERLIAEANQAGGRDNITAIVARFDADRLC